MQTTKPIATISYNTEDFLNYVLNQLIKEKVISFWLYVKHKAEDDELKDHIHVYMEPNKRVNTEELRERFKEKDLSGTSDKPLGVQPFVNSSSFNDMFLYFKHDLRYLLSLKQERKYHYLDADVKTSDRDYMQERLRTSPLPKSMKNIDILEGLARGDKATDILMRNNVPLYQRPSTARAMSMIYQDLLGIERDAAIDQLEATTDKGASAIKRD